MSKAKLNIAYSGPAVDTGAMDVNDLAPALLAIGRLLEDANYVLNQQNSTVAVHVKSDFKTGSFQIYLEIIQSFVDQAKDLLEPHKVYTAVNILTYLGLTIGIPVNLIKLMKLLRDRKITKITKIDTGKFKIETDGNYDSIEVSEETVNLYRNMKVRKNMQDMLKPLEQVGIEKFVVREKEQNIEEITKPEIEYFQLPEIAEEEILDVETEGAFNVIGVFFEEGLKWRLYDGENRIHALIKDGKFLEAMNQGKISFAKGDILKVRLRTRQWQTDSGLKKEHEVLEVLKHIRAWEQIPLPFKKEE